VEQASRLFRRCTGETPEPPNSDLTALNFKRYQYHILLGESTVPRLVMVVFVEQDEDTMRIISARKATPHERRRYEEGI
jgi:uncharacterized DUF497 family protein